MMPNYRALRRATLLLVLTAPLVATQFVAARSEESNTVTIKSFAFNPPSITVAVGTMVTWVNTDDEPHTVTEEGKTFHSAALDTDDKFSFTFDREGTFAYHCTLHPHMVGEVVVKAKP